LATASDQEYESIPDDEINLLVRKFRALHKFHKERRRWPRGYFECGDTTHFITDYPKQKKIDSSNKYNYTNRNDYNNKDDDKKKYRFRDKKKKKSSLSEPVASPQDLSLIRFSATRGTPHVRSA
jgi:hypothetical protein